MPGEQDPVLGTQDGHAALELGYPLRPAHHPPEMGEAHVSDRHHQVQGRTAGLGRSKHVAATAKLGVVRVRADHQQAFAGARGMIEQRAIAAKPHHRSLGCARAVPAKSRPAASAGGAS